MARRRIQRRKPRRTRRRYTFLWFAGGTVLLGCVVLGGYLFYLDRIITSTFEGRRWSVPARVYARPLELYAGARLSADDLEVELKRVGYRRGDNLQQAGTYRRQDDAFDVHLRSFAFGEGHRNELVAHLEFQGAQLTRLHNVASDEELAIAQLDPPVIGSIFASHGEDRIIVTPEQTPPLLEQTLKAVEDRHFDTHPGFDIVGIARAVWVNMTSGGLSQGGSTLTQQLVRSFYLSNEKTFTRKINELLMAVILEARFEKRDLLNAYINEIFLGQDGGRAIHGFGLGSQFYFDKPLSELAPEQIAALVSVIRGPSYYDPFRHPARVQERRDRILQQMREFQLIDAGQLQRALATPLSVVRDGRRGGGYYPAFMDLVREQLKNDYDGDELASRGYRLFATLDSRLQELAQRAVSDTLVQLEQARDLPAGQLQAAMVVTSTQTGDVLAIVGGRTGSLAGFNRALNAKRAIGSLVKPVVFLTAFESGRFSLASVIEDAPIEMEMRGAPTWKPGNFDHRVHGPVPAIRALSESMNLATVRLGLDVGLERVAERIGELSGRAEGVPAPLPSLLLGAVEMSPMEVARMYEVFASGGFTDDLKSVVGVEDDQGKPLNRYEIAPRKVAEPEAVAQVNAALQAVMQRGTAKASRFSGRGLAGKTGTTNDYRDSWFAAFNDDLLSVVWVGYDDNSSSGLSGSNGAMRIWDALMTEVGPRGLNVALPGGFELVNLDFERGGLVEGPCGGGAASIVSVPVPISVARQLEQECGIQAVQEESVVDRIGSWLRNSRLFQ